MLFLPLRSSAQVAYCFDSTAVNQGISCPPIYDPLCGCDGITYRNYCEMYYHHGIIDYRSGICEPMAIEANPNPVVASMHITLVVKEKSDVFLRIFDLYGKTWYFRQFRDIEKEIFDIEMLDYPVGIYFMHVQSGQFTVIRRFVKFPTR